ncbi:MAG: polysulfide reductase NrfD [Chloroflexi bacterium]|nr:polysulfide reductase NrfD [Chloroflexota bacterium]
MEPVRHVEHFRERLERVALAPLAHSGWRYFLWVFFLAGVVGWGAYAFLTQYREGLIVTAMRDRISWGLYIALFVFFIGISHAGTLISAILRASQAGWRTPVTRIAEFITVVALMVGALMPLIDMGRPDRLLNMFFYGRWQSPLVWDILSITTYLTGSIIYLYLPMIPDIALVRDRLGPTASGLKRWVYTAFSLGWQGTPDQQRYLGRAITLMMLLIIPIAISVHTVVSWVFAMTLREPWDNPMFGIYFVAGAIFSGIAALIILMAVLRRIFHLEEYITPKHFINLGYLMGAMTFLMIYFNASEYIVTGYKMAGDEAFHFEQLFTGPLAPYYWFYALGGLILPGLLILFPWTRNIKGIVAAAGLVIAGMWVERYFIVVGGLRVPLMPYAAASYFPSWVEWSIMAGALAGFALIISVFVKLFPVIAVWEVAEHHEATVKEGAEEKEKTVPRRRLVSELERSHESV